MSEFFDPVHPPEGPAVGAPVTASYAFMNDGALCVMANGAPLPAPPLTMHLHALFRAMVESRHYVCAGAKSAFGRGTYRFGVYPDLASEAATLRLHQDLVAYASERPTMPGIFRSFIAVFLGPYLADEAAFETCLWEQLQALHDEDVQRYPWDKATSCDPKSPDFSYSVAGTSFFVVGLHPASSRVGRKFAYPSLVFNAHDQFEALRLQGTFDRLATNIRERDVALQGSINPNLANYGSASEARQYSGRAVADDWKCPFHARVRAHTNNAAMTKPEGEPS